MAHAREIDEERNGMKMWILGSGAVLGAAALIVAALVPAAGVKPQV
jgi:hypothetical protein